MADVYEDQYKKLCPMIAFMCRQHTDPVDQLVARFLNLRWDADVTCDMLREDSAARVVIMHTTILADAVLGQVQKLRHYDFLERVIDNLKLENAFLLDDALAINQAPCVFEKVAYYMAIAANCEEQIASEEVRLSMKPPETINSDDFMAGLNWREP